jgi:hypothetical protein
MSGDGNVIFGGRFGDDDNNLSLAPIFKWNGSRWEEQFAGNGLGSAYNLVTSSSSQNCFNYDGSVFAVYTALTSGCTMNCKRIRVYKLNADNRYVQRGNIIYVNNFGGVGLELSDDGNTLLTNNGAAGVVIYDFNGTDWVQRGLAISLAGENNMYTYSNFTPDGNTVIVGFISADTYGLNAGLAKVVTWDGTTWQQKGTDIPGISAEDKFGYIPDISADGNTILVSAAGTEVNPDRGHTRVYTWDGTNWNLKGQELQIIPEIQLGYDLGVSQMDNSGDTITLSYYKTTPGQRLDVYVWDGVSSWQVLPNPIVNFPNYYLGENILSDNGKRILMRTATIPPPFVASEKSLLVYSMECFPSYDTITEIACTSYIWSANSTTYTNSGIYTDTLPDARGCDSIVTLNLTINAPAFMSFYETACDSYTWEIDGATYTYTSSGTYTHIGATLEGCAYTYTLDLIVNNSSSETFTETACDSYTWDANGTTYNSSGTYTHQSTNTAGCTHTSTLNLVINNSTNESVIESACESFFWDLTGITYTTNTTTSHFSTNAVGCPHETSLFLVISQPIEEDFFVSTCDSYTWPINGQTYTSSGTYTNLGTSPAGCTLTSNLILDLNFASSSNISESACESFTWDLNGVTYTTSGVYTHVGTNEFGCEHITNLNLTINNNITENIDLIVCDSYLWDLTGETYQNSGTYTHQVNTGNCLTTYNLNLTIDPIDITTNQDGLTITSAEAGATYQWIDCENGNAPIVGETNQSFTASTSGIYAVIVSENNCSATSECAVVFPASISETNLGAKIKLFPNPTSGKITLENTGSEIKSICILNALGQKLEEVKKDFSSTKIELDLPFEDGIYFLEIQTRNGANNLLRVIKK